MDAALAHAVPAVLPLVTALGAPGSGGPSFQQSAATAPPRQAEQNLGAALQCFTTLINAGRGGPGRPRA
jgi:hypothetical protein